MIEAATLMFSYRVAMLPGLSLERVKTAFLLYRTG